MSLETSRIWKKKHPKYMHEWRQKHSPDYQRNALLKFHYGINLKEEKELLRKQKGKCAICCRRITTKKNTPKKRSAHVDHCHITNKVRGILCSSCNARLGVLEDKQFVQSALKYLRKYK